MKSFATLWSSGTGKRSCMMESSLSIFLYLSYALFTAVISSLCVLNSFSFSAAILLAALACWYFGYTKTMQSMTAVTTNSPAPIYLLSMYASLGLKVYKVCKVESKIPRFMNFINSFFKIYFHVKTHQMFFSVSNIVNHKIGDVFARTIDIHLPDQHRGSRQSAAL